MEWLPAFDVELASDCLLMMIHAYFDESGKFKDPSDFVVFGGIVGRIDETSVFTREWRELLGPDIAYISMKDAMRLETPFRGWTEARRDELLIECAKLIKSRSGMSFVSEISKADFATLPEPLRKKLRDPIYGGFEVCVRALVREFPNRDLCLWCDESEEYASTCLKTYQMVKSKSLDLKPRLVSLAFGDDTKFPGLQAADMVAYVANRILREASNAPRIVREIHSILRADKGSKKHMIYTDTASLGSGIMEPIK